MTSSGPRMANLSRFRCHNCAQRTDFEQPPCPDGHGPDCPEWYCTRCGTATLVGWSLGRLARDHGGTRSPRVA